MPNIEKVENLVIGSGGAGKFVAWTMAGAGRRTIVVERAFIGGACPNVCLSPQQEHDLFSQGHFTGQAGRRVRPQNRVVKR
jgi:choline dehydrogenase-like flavoprotein